MNDTDPPLRNRRLTAAIGVTWVAVALLLAVYAGWVRAPLQFIKHLYHRNISPLALVGGGLWLFAVVVVTPLGDRRRAPLRLWVGALLWVALLVVFRDQRHVLGDSDNLLRDPIRRLEAGGWYTFYDELVGMWLPLRFARVLMATGLQTKAAILLAYQCVAFAAGGAFFFVAHRLANTLPSPRFALLLFLGAAHSLHFAGYVENYQLSSLLLTLGFCLAIENDLEATLPVTMIFAAAVVFHAVSVWSVFALIYLAARTDRFPRTAAIHSAAGLALIAITAALFAVVLTPGVGFAHAHADTLLGNMLDTLRTRSLIEHATQLLRTAAAPLFAIVIAFIVAPRATWAAFGRPDARFALLYLAGFCVHQLVWKSSFGLQRDWDLYGYTWLPLTYLAARVTPRSLPLELGLAILQTLVGFSWLLATSVR